MPELHDGLPVPGYKPQPTTNINLVSMHKIAEERLLRMIDTLYAQPHYDKRWLNIARTNLEIAFMALNRSVFQPERISLAEDDADTAKSLRSGGPEPS